MGSISPRRYWLLTYPRTASNLLIRVLGLDEQPNIVPGDTNGGYFFLPVVKVVRNLNLRGRGVGEWTEDEKKQVMESFQACFNTLQSYLDHAASNNCSLYAKEHIHFLAEPVALSRQLLGMHVDEDPWMVDIPDTYGKCLTRSLGNETVLPDEFLRKWSPTFLIRHPALAFPSRYRAYLDLDCNAQHDMQEYQGTLSMTLHWTRVLYEWYGRNMTPDESFIDGEASWPLVLDADDLMTSTDVVVRYAEILGLDQSKLRFTWKPLPEEERSKMEIYPQRFLSTLIASEGIVKGKTSANIDVDTEVNKWHDEFGKDAALKIEQLVRAALPDYEFMKARRLRAKGAGLSATTKNHRGN